MEIPFQFFSAAPEGSKTSNTLPVVFAHANGYPPGCYLPLLESLSSHCPLYAAHLRPLWPGADPAEINDWRPLSADLLEFCDQRQLNSVIGVGHSVGAVSMLRAAMRQPQRFAALVLIEPVLMPPWVILAWQAANLFHLIERSHPLIKSASRRRQVFASQEEIYNGYRRKPIFRYLSDEHLRAFTDGLIQELPDGRQGLRYSVEWEVRIYATGIKADLELWRGLPGLKMPILVLRGAETDTFWNSTARLLKLIRPATQVVTFEQTTHLLPMEKPVETAGLIEAFLASQNLS